MSAISRKYPFVSTYRRCKGRQKMRLCAPRGGKKFLNSLFIFKLDPFVDVRRERANVFNILLVAADEILYST